MFSVRHLMLAVHSAAQPGSIINIPHASGRPSEREKWENLFFGTERARKPGHPSILSDGRGGENISKAVRVCACVLRPHAVAVHSFVRPRDHRPLFCHGKKPCSTHHIINIFMRDIRIRLLLSSSLTARNRACIYCLDPCDYH